jgi:hypothetical protein
MEQRRNIAKNLFEHGKVVIFYFGQGIVAMTKSPKKPIFAILIECLIP